MTDAPRMNAHTAMDDLVPRTPIDRVAARVIRGGVHFVPAGQITGGPHFDSPPPMVCARKVWFIGLNSNFTDCTGMRRGRLTVVGLSDMLPYKSKYKPKARWVCRCDCGKYLYRHTKAILNAGNHEDRCGYCMSTLRSSRGAAHSTLQSRWDRATSK